MVSLDPLAPGIKLLTSNPAVGFERVGPLHGEVAGVCGIEGDIELAAVVAKSGLFDLELGWSGHNGPRL